MGRVCGGAGADDGAGGEEHGECHDQDRAEREDTGEVVGIH